jgi:succinate dehydrogenase / fumarate reductase iron-sulfur subunit/fumarate reductase iron-sulfur subunit
MKVNIKRFDGRDFYFQTYEVPIEGNPTVLEVLGRIKEEIDPSLSFRAMCRSSVCGTCGLKVNGVPALACSTRVSGEELTLEPLEGFRPLRDLVTDQEGLERLMREFSLWVVPRGKGVSTEARPTISNQKGWDCILCGICDSVCPPLLEGSAFAGPMAITRLHRIINDPRDAIGKERLNEEISERLKGCVHCSYCTLRCPKSCMPERWVTLLEGQLRSMGYIQKSGQEFDFLGF